ncbi:MAG TPA: hypothetical protein VFR02_01980 [bacterium]|nr:hypothetical protein [bacterium]
MQSYSVGPALGYLILSFFTWSATFAVVVFGSFLRRKILLWDENWKETLEQGGTSIKDYADDLQRSHEKVRSIARLLGFFLVVILALMGWLVYLGVIQRPLLGPAQVEQGLWLLALVSLSVVLPAYVNFSVGSYLAETMLLKANVFVYKEVREEYKEKKAKIQLMEKTRELKAKREAAKAAAALEAKAAK